jgi:hypothetical protein
MSDTPVDIGPTAVDMDTLTFLDEAPTELPPDLHPGEDIKVVRSYRIPLSLDQWLTEQARARNTNNSELVRELLELGRQTLEGADRPISLADALRALATVRPLDAAS